MKRTQIKGDGPGFGRDTIARIHRKQERDRAE